MSQQPGLSAHPYLHNLLRNDHRANTEFNAYVSSVRGRRDGGSRHEELQKELEAANSRASEAVENLKKVELTMRKAVRFIKILGEVMETQLELQPYAQDVSTKNSYKIRFSADQVRLALSWYWDVLAEKMESVLRNNVEDPADEREGP